MEIGECIESCIWVTGDENPAIRKQYEQDVKQAIADLCSEEGMEHGPVTFTEKNPDSGGIPPVPAHIKGSRVRLLVAEATIIGVAVLSSQGSFVANLEKDDLEKLRILTRRAWAKAHPNDPLDDVQCDEFIEQVGPEAAIDTLRRNHNAFN